MRIRIHRRGEILGYTADSDAFTSPLGFSHFRTIECQGDPSLWGPELRSLIAGIIKYDFYIPSI